MSRTPANHSEITLLSLAARVMNRMLILIENQKKKMDIQKKKKP